MAPERGISAMLVLAEVLVTVRAGGWFGKIEKNGRTDTSNVGIVNGTDGRPAGVATNQLTIALASRGYRDTK